MPALDHYLSTSPNTGLGFPWPARPLLFAVQVPHSRPCPLPSSLPPSRSASLPRSRPSSRSLARSLPRSLAPSLARSLAPSLPPSLAPSLARSLARSLPSDSPPRLSLSIIHKIAALLMTTVRDGPSRCVTQARDPLAVLVKGWVTVQVIWSTTAILKGSPKAQLGFGEPGRSRRKGQKNPPLRSRDNKSIHRHLFWLSSQSQADVQLFGRAEGLDSDRASSGWAQTWSYTSSPVLRAYPNFSISDALDVNFWILQAEIVPIHRKVYIATKAKTQISSFLEL